MKASPASRAALQAARFSLSTRRTTERVLPHQLSSGDTILLNGHAVRLLSQPYFDPGYGQFLAHVEKNGSGEIVPLGWTDVPRLRTQG